MKKLAMIVVVVLSVLIAIAFAKDLIIEMSVETGVGMVTGLKLDIGELKAGLLNTMVDITDLKLYNPPDFEDKVMVDMPKIYVDYDLSAILKGDIHLSAVQIELREFVVVKNRVGKLNLDALKVVQAQEEGDEPEEKEAGKMPPIQIDVLELKIGRAVFKDYSKGGEPSIREYNLNLDERYENITDAYSVVNLIVVKALARTSIAKLARFDVGELQRTIPGVLASTQKMAGQAAVEVKKTAVKAFNGFGNLPFGEKKK